MSLSAWEQRQSRWNRLHLCVVLLWFLALLLERFVTERGTLLIQNVLIPLSFLTAGGWMFRRREKAGADFWLLAGFLCWYAVTRILNGCHYLQDESGFLPRLACFILAIYPLAAEWKADRREKAFHFCLALFTGVLTILAWVSLYAAIRGEPVQPFSFARVIGFNDVYGARLNLWDLHPNVTAAIFVAGFGMSLCGVSLARRWPAKAAYAVAAVSLFAAASLTVSRTAMIAASLEAAGFVFLLIAGRLPSKRKALCVVLALLLACGTAYGAYKGYEAIVSGVASASRALQHAAETTLPTAQPELSSADTTEEPASPAADSIPAVSQTEDSSPANSAGEGILPQNRELTQDLLTLTGRTNDIYGAALPVLKQRPSILLTGSLDGETIGIATRMAGRPLYHWHNSLLQTLMLTGIPGFLAAAAFLVLVVIAGVRTFFSSKAPLYRQLLVLPVAGLCLQGMLESYLFCQVELPFYFFLVLSGYLLAFDRENRVCRK